MLFHPGNHTNYIQFNDWNKCLIIFNQALCEKTLYGDTHICLNKDKVADYLTVNTSTELSTIASRVIN